MECRYCGSEDVEYIGIDDGGGDFGEAICEDWKCHHCGQHFDGDCIGAAVDGNLTEEESDLEARRADFENRLFGDESAHLDVGDISF